MARRGVLANRGSHCLGQLLVKYLTVSKYHKKNNADVVLPVLPNHDALNNALELFDLTINLSGAYAHATWV